jgi:GeoRSP system PqqD family protein
MSVPVKRNPDLVWRDEPDEREAILAALERGEDAGDRGWVVVVDGGQIHQLNLIAGEIWCLADGSRDEAAIAAELAHRYDAPMDEIGADVSEFLRSCRDRGWLE